VEWCDEEEIENLNNLTGRKLHEFRLWRRTAKGEITATTEKTQMDTVRVFIRFLESIDAVQPELSEKVISPDLDSGQNVRSVMLGTERAESILDYLAQYEYASREHVVTALMWHASLRRGAVRALDVDDYNSEEQFLQVRHRPDTDTPIKNQTEGERLIALSSEICTLLDDWVETQRPDVTDNYDRQPLIATSQGRIAPTSVTSIVYGWTRPCKVNQECPVNRDPEKCEASAYSKSCKCPASVSSHAVRRGSITHFLESDVPIDAVSSRANVGRKVLKTHYDERDEKTKMEQRRGYLKDI
jgi:integrase